MTIKSHDERIRLLEENLQKAVHLMAIQQGTIDQISARSTTFQTEIAEAMREFVEALRRLDVVAAGMRQELAGLSDVAENFAKFVTVTEALFKKHDTKIKSLGLEVGALRFSRQIDEEARG